MIRFFIIKIIKVKQLQIFERQYGYHRGVSSQFMNYNLLYSQLFQILNRNIFMAERHSLQITVEIKKIKLQVRFPCKLSFQIKIDNAQFQSQNTCELVNGQCNPNEIIQADTDALFDKVNSQYENKEMRIVVQMHSNNGIIPAGSISFNHIFKKKNQIIEYIRPLEKCPDRSAQITFNISCQLVHRKKSNPIYQSQMLHKKQEPKNTNLQYSFSNAMLKKSQIRKLPEPETFNPSKTQHFFSPLQKKSFDFRQSFKSQNYLQNVLNQFDQTQENQFGRGKAQGRVRRPIQKEKDYSQPIEKSLLIKQIAKLKGELRNLQIDDKKNELIRVKQQNEAIMAQLDRVKQKLKALERKERQFTLQLKQAKQQADKNKNRYLQIETIKNENENLLIEKEKTLRQIQTELKRKGQMIQDLNITLNNLQKRLQTKQNSFQEQLKRWNQKYTGSQSERQKLTFQHSNILMKLEQSEKKYQINIKEKEKSFIEDRNRLNKRIEQLSQELDTVKEGKKQRESQLVELKQELKLEQKKGNQLGQKLTVCQSELELVKIELKKELEQHIVFQTEIESYKIIEEEKGILRKKNNELTSQLARHKDKVQKMTVEINNNETKLKQFQRLLAERTKEKDLLQNRITVTKKQLDNLKRQDQKIIRQSETLSVYNVNANKKLNVLKEKLELQLQENKQLVAQYESQIIYLTKSKEEYETEVEQMKWVLQKQSQQFTELTNKLKEANQQILQLNSTIFINEDKLKKNDEEKKIFQSMIDEMKKTIDQGEEKQQSLSEKIKLLTTNIYNLQKQYQSSQSLNFAMKNKLQEVEASLSQQRQNSQKYLKQKQKYLSQKNNELNQLQLQNTSLKQELSFKQRESTIKDNQLTYLKQSLKVSQSDATHHIIKLTDSKQSLKIIQRQLENLSIESEKIQKCLQEEKRNSLALKNDWEMYKKNTTAALERFIEQMLKEDENNFNQQFLISFPDEAISTMQVQAIKKKNASILKYQNTISSVNEEKWAIQNQLKTVKMLSGQKQEQLQGLLKAERDRGRKILAQQQLERRQAQKAINLLEQNLLHLTSQNEKKVNSIQKLEEQCEELKKENMKMAEERDILMFDLAQQKQIVLGYKQKQIKWHSSIQNKISNANSQNSTVISSLKYDLELTSKRLENESKLNGQKNEMIKRLQLQINDLTYKNQSIESVKLDLQKKVSSIEQNKKNSENKYRLMQEQINKLVLQLQKIKGKQINQKIKFQEIQEKLNSIHIQLTDTLVDKQKMKSQLSIAHGLHQQLEQNRKNQIQKLKYLAQKYSQQNNQLQQKIIQLNSSLELKIFQINQKESQICSLQSNLNQVKEQLTKKNQQHFKIVDNLHNMNNKHLYTQQNLEILQSERQFLQSENERLKERASILQEELDLAQQQTEIIDQKEKELISLREELQLARLEIDKLTNQMIRSPKSQRSQKSSLFIGEQKRRIRQLEQIIQYHNLDLQVERQKLINGFSQQKITLLKENQNLKAEMFNLKQLFDFQRAQLNREIEVMNEQIEKLNQQVEYKHEDHSIYQKLNHLSLNHEFQLIGENELQSSQRLNQLIHQH